MYYQFDVVSAISPWQDATMEINAVETVAKQAPWAAAERPVTYNP